ncbi:MULTISPECIES: fumarylacetoacetate hydrolase family protein [unclassified Mesorhizobium]|uniref:fumarylacetoacetate hydrolase family protein n=1 Tax=unclassified Mesorhizobium TaxID=325217 RepID=UPI000FCAB4F7|nr:MULTISPECIES: fumarylacetoacetate hydrolase family protein [unclassified Mesorhizobium]RUW52775.1 FAA hydrolase family protein [Mesorhizobium sp. M8A.F.Ca.ET.021.01.1.1]RWC86921.1 MAG: FAA hydrolase family protein [Mesorhizobium sp.]TGP92723.1 FAA hydrolase family protein [Mesorhizobium sp. M8A.F.Ca.ET.218.01.1.1]TGS42958.1 FAA hydrolase family protein [Mesorhizobium sp. M8A.F.Ca.ET.182.01.1.1]TGS79960.1 FAA hydrolase family protein [Mesorhizobium sp. M8A.F.Ca.ET.181.01.1.1]
MRVATFSISGERRVGLVDLDAQTIAPFDFSVDQAMSGILALVERNGAGIPRTLSPIPLAQVEIEAPIPQPRRNIFCVGKNYHEHAHEFARSGFDSSAGAGAIPKHPIIFSKVPESVVANHASVLIDPSVSTAIDYEAELAVIIGKGGRGISRENALDHVWGYTIVNDVTARDLQGKYSQWLIGKSQDTFCPMGPWAVTRDELDLATAGIRCFVNEDLRQDSRISLLIFDIPTIIATLSQGITLKSGDIIATGTPVGVGIGFDPPKYLKAGDVVRIEIDGIGTLENRFAEHAQ